MEANSVIWMAQMNARIYAVKFLSSTAKAGIKEKPMRVSKDAILKARPKSYFVLSKYSLAAIAAILGARKKTRHATKGSNDPKRESSSVHVQPRATPNAPMITLVRPGMRDVRLPFRERGVVSAIRSFILHRAKKTKASKKARKPRVASGPALEKRIQSITPTEAAHSIESDVLDRLDIVCRGERTCISAHSRMSPAYPTP